VNFRLVVGGTLYFAGEVANAERNNVLERQAVNVLRLVAVKQVLAQRIAQVLHLFFLKHSALVHLPLEVVQLFVVQLGQQDLAREQVARFFEVALKAFHYNVEVTVVHAVAARCAEVGKHSLQLFSRVLPHYAGVVHKRSSQLQLGHFFSAYAVL